MNSTSSQIALAALIFLIAINPSHANYTVTPYQDTATGNTEQRLMFNGFHFGSLISDSTGHLIFRPHPDQNDVNGWGISWYIAPFLAGADSSGGVVAAVQAEPNGIALQLSGQVASGTATAFGHWTSSLLMSYNSARQAVAATGSLDIQLPARLSSIGKDLNLERLSTNTLVNVPLQSGGVGDTGDMKEAVISYGVDLGSRQFVWRPPLQPAHFPTDASSQLRITAVGQINDVDTLALGQPSQIAVATKPTLLLSFDSANDPLSAGLYFDTQQAQNFAADNIGINQLLLKQNNLSTDLHFSVAMSSTVPVPEPATWALWLAGLGAMVVLGCVS